VGNLRPVIASAEILPGTFRSIAVGARKIGYEKKRTSRHSMSCRMGVLEANIMEIA
jgi:hypothetical protein